MAAGAVLVLAGTTAFLTQQAHTTTVTDQDHVKVTYTRQNHVGETESGLKYAPRPTEEFRDSACSLSPRKPPAHVARDELTLPAAQVRVPVGTSSDLSSLPPAPHVVRYQDSVPPGAPRGNTIIAGHVDYGPGVKSTGGGELSPFGNLHTVKPCSHVYVRAADDTVHDYVVTDIYTVAQPKIEDTGIYSSRGEHSLVLVTCSGPSVGDTGAKTGFTYQYNLVVQATPVAVTS